MGNTKKGSPVSILLNRSVTDRKGTGNHHHGPGSNFATVVQSIYDQSGVSDPYFSSLNETVTVSIAELLMLTYHLVHPGQVPKASDVQNLINDCSRCRPYLDALIKHYSVHSLRSNGNDRTEQVAEIVDVGQWQQVYTTINNDLLGENKANMYDRCNGLRNLINNFLNDPLVRDVFEAEETVDFDKALEYGEVIILNYALERGDSVATGFGLFFLLSYETAVLRRPGSENDRIKNFIYIDELLCSCIRNCKVSSHYFASTGLLSSVPSRHWIR